MPGYDAHAPKRPVNLSLNEDLVRQDFERRLDDAIAAWNAFDADHGSFADEYIDF